MYGRNVSYVYVYDRIRRNECIHTVRPRYGMYRVRQQTAQGWTDSTLQGWIYDRIKLRSTYGTGTYTIVQFITGTGTGTGMYIPTGRYRYRKGG